MSAPRLTRRVVLERPARTPDGAGGFAAGWVPLGTHWAEVVPVASGGAADEGMAPRRQRHRITLRAAPPGSPARPVAGQRLREGARIFEIMGVTERDAGARFLVCYTEEAVP